MAEATPSLMAKATLSSKNIKHCEKESEDRISQLPDEILGHILSFLPTKYAVGTSILSSRWRLIWTLVSNLIFYDSLVLNENRKEIDLMNAFMNFVDKVLNLHSLHSIQKFELRCSAIYDSSQVNKWICAAVMRNVVDLDITLSKRSSAPPFQLPSSLLSCSRLKFLRLRNHMILNVPDPVSLPNLKVLVLDCLQYSDSDGIGRLISTSYVLEELFIRRMRHDPVKNLHIESRSLKRLKIYTVINNTKENYQYKIVIDAPKVAVLVLVDPTSKEWTLNVPSLGDASIVVRAYNLNNDEERVITFLRQISHVKRLYLFDFSPIQIVFGFSEVSDVVPCFRNLTDLLWRNIPVSNLFRFLNYTPNLKYLILKLQGTSILFPMVNSRNYLVPRCLSSSLQKVRFEDFRASDVEIQMMAYILKKALFLKVMIISFGNSIQESKVDVSEKLLNLPKASRYCQIIFA